MKTGEIIRKYRKSKNMTQEEMAKRLGVTAPAVNKWENGGSLPDITLVSPIARLLGTTPDELLSFRDTLTTEEINEIVRQMNSLFQEKSYDEVFAWAMKKLEEYPSCTQLIWQLTVILDARRTSGTILGEETAERGECEVMPFIVSPDFPSSAGRSGGASEENSSAYNISADSRFTDTAKYDSRICSLYERVLESDNETLRTSGADSLFGFYMRKKQYDKAEEYLKYFSLENPERKRKQATVYDATGRTQEAFQAWEELLFTGYGTISATLNGMYLSALRNGDMDKAHFLVEKQVEMARCFDMGKYHEASPRLELAIMEKDTETAIAATEGILSGVEQICGFTRSRLYEHMAFKAPSPEFIAEMKKGLLAFFQDEETCGFLKEDVRWQKLVR